MYYNSQPNILKPLYSFRIIGSFFTSDAVKTGYLKRRQKYSQIFINEMFKKIFYFFTCILPNYMAHDITNGKITSLKIG